MDAAIPQAEALSGSRREGNWHVRTPRRSKGQVVIAVYVVVALSLVLVAFFAGLFARSLSVEKDAASFLEDKVLNKLPPYVAARKYTDRLAGLDEKANEDLKPVLVGMYNGWQLGLLTDEFQDGYVAVFIPAAPDPSSGLVQIVSADQITTLDISYRDALACLEKSGRSLPHLLASTFEKHPLTCPTSAPLRNI